MFFTNNFLDIIKSVFQEIQDFYDNPVDWISPSNSDIFVESVNLWMSKIPNYYNIDRKKREDIIELAKDKDTFEIINSIRKAVEPIFKRRGIFSNMNNIDNNIKIIVLIALGFTCVGLILFLLNRSTEQDNQERKVTNFQLSQNKYLILVIGVDNVDFINSLSQNNCPDYKICEELYKATEFLWIGSNDDLSKFDELFSKKPELEYREKSEYDVYFVKFQLTTYNDLGFSSGVSSLKRIDAFRKLAEIGKVA